jgi:hypothetical protein
MSIEAPIEAPIEEIPTKIEAPIEAQSKPTEEQPKTAPVEKVKKPRTEKQIQAFKQAQLKRQENIKAKKESKPTKTIAIVEEKPVEKPETAKRTNPEDYVTPDKPIEKKKVKQVSYESDDSDSDEEVIVVKKKKPKKKTIIIEDSSDSSDEEPEEKPRPKQSTFQSMHNKKTRPIFRSAFCD